MTKKATTESEWKRYAIVGGLIAVIIIVMIIATSATPKQNQSTETITNTPTVTEEKKEPINLTLNGNGDTATEMFNLRQGPVVFTLKHSGSEHFSVWLVDDQGNEFDLLANDTGEVDISTASQIRKDGKYLLNVSADGEWTITAKQE